MLASVGLVTIALKLMMVAHGDIGSVGAIVRAQGSADIIVTSVVASAANVGLVAAFVAVPTWGEAVRERDPVGPPTIMLLIAVAATFFLSPASTFVVVLFFVVCFAASSIAMARRARHKGKRKLTGGVEDGPVGYFVMIGLLAIALWVAIAGSARMWLPAERIELENGTHVVGYVLEEGSGLTVLRENDRAVVRVELDDVAARQYCRTNDQDPRTVLSRLLGDEKPRYPLCDERVG